MIHQLAPLCFYSDRLEQMVHFFRDGFGLPHSRQAWIADPDGNAIELMEYSQQSLQLRRV